MIRTYIALGSNLNDPIRQVTMARAAITQLPDSHFVSCSPWYQSQAIGPGQQPDYINGVLALDTNLKPLALLAELQAIEHQQQRTRTERWAPRTIDLDLLLYGDYSINLSPTLSVPHPRLCERSFVLYPLFDIAPALRLPDGSLVKDHLTQCASTGLHRYQEPITEEIEKTSGM